MSLLWRDKLCIALRPDTVEIVRTGGGLRPKALATATIPCAVRHDQPAWSAPVAALKAHLQTLTSRCDVSIILSNHFVRYAVVPWSAALVNDEERHALARICFERIYGDMARHWALRVRNAGYGQPCIASAVDQGLIDMIQDTCDGRKMRLVSVQPWLMAAINRCRHQMKAKDFRLIIAEPGQICMLRSYQGACTEIKSMMVSTSLAEGLDLLMQRESAISPADGLLRPYLITAGFLQSELTPAITRKFQLLTLKKGINDMNDQRGVMSMSACGVPG